MIDGPPAQAWVWLARIRKSQGRKGEVFAELLTDFPDKFKERKHVWLLSPAESEGQSGGKAASGNAVRGQPVHGKATGIKAAASVRPDLAEREAEGVSREAEVVDFFLHKDGVVLRFAGLESIPEAERLRGWIVAVPRAERVELPDDEMYVSDLIGCVLVDVATAAAPEIGVIVAVDRSAGPVALLVVLPTLSDGDSGDEVLVPLAKAYLRRIDLEGRRIEMALPEGLVAVQGSEP